jgi:branched-chain amino acid transport system permease protein
LDFATSLGLLPATLIDGTVLGLLYATIALGYTMVYGVLRLINFAHGEIFMIGGIAAIELLTFVLVPLGMPPLMLLVFGLLFAALVSALVALGAERVAYRPLRKRRAPRLVPLITAIGLSLLLQDAVRFGESLFGNFIRPFPAMPLFDQGWSLGAGVMISYKSLTILLVGILMLAFLYYLVNHTRLGQAIRAVAQDQRASTLMGIDVDRVVSSTFAIGGALAGMAGVLYALQFGKLDPFAGFIPGLKAFTAAVLGGIGSIPGAMIGGVLLGLVEVFSGTFLPILTDGVIGTDYKDIFVFGLLILVLIFRPGGLRGKSVVEKV